MLANLVGQVGCVTGLVALVIIGVAFGAGWLLDDWMGNERRVVTVILMLGSFPVTLYAMVRISLLMLARAQERVAALDQEDKSEETTQT
jgi:hypothetical protein